MARRLTICVASSAVSTATLTTSSATKADLFPRWPGLILPALMNVISSALRQMPRQPRPGALHDKKRAEPTSAARRSLREQAVGPLTRLSRDQTSDHSASPAVVMDDDTDESGLDSIGAARFPHAHDRGPCHQPSCRAPSRQAAPSRR
jgi:hypothetical protein